MCGCVYDWMNDSGVERVPAINNKYHMAQASRIKKEEKKTEMNEMK